MFQASHEVHLHVHDQGRDPDVELNILRHEAIWRFELWGIRAGEPVMMDEKGQQLVVPLMRVKQKQTVKMVGLAFGSELKNSLGVIKFEDSDSLGEREKERAW